MMPYEYGMRVRKGYREYQIGLDQGSSTGVHTIIPFDGIEENNVNDRLFAVTNEGIYDVSVAGDAPILKFTFANQDPQAGYGVFSHYVGNDEKDVLFYADSLNGLFTYDSDTETWVQTIGITGGIVVENVRFIVLHKQRIWLIEENSTIGWYLPVGSVAGKATEFFFGAKFRHGGNLVGLYNWSVDGGSGVDDMLVAVSRAGDVLPYQGEDPSTANTWSLRGTYYIGEVPRGGYIGSEHGGELYLLSAFGLIGMNTLLRGVNTARGDGTALHDALAAKIAWLLRDDMDRSIDQLGWEVRTIPSEGALVVASPRQPSGEYIQYVYNVSTNAWGMWRSVPMTCFNSWKARVVVGTEDNRVLYMDVTADNVLITPPVDALNGTPIIFSLLTSFQDLGAPAVFKRVKLVRPDFISHAKPNTTVKVNYDFDLSEALQPIEAPPDIAGANWDVGIWDEAVWDAAIGVSFGEIGGTWGIGRYVAIAMNGSAREKTTFLGWDVIYDAGGPMI
jgi:hypothetical protein